jgi:hypothetical protein
MRTDTSICSLIAGYVAMNWAMKGASMPKSDTIVTRSSPVGLIWRLLATVSAASEASSNLAGVLGNGEAELGDAELACGALKQTLTEALPELGNAA